MRKNRIARRIISLVLLALLALANIGCPQVVVMYGMPEPEDTEEAN